MSKIYINAAQYPKALKIRLYCATAKTQHRLQQVVTECCIERRLPVAGITAVESEDTHKACGHAIELALKVAALPAGVSPRLLGPEGWGAFLVDIAARAEENGGPQVVGRPRGCD